MANVTIPDLTALSANVAVGDLLEIADVSNGNASRKVTQAELVAILGTPASATLTNATGLPISTGLAGAGTGVLTALAINVGSAGAPVVLNGALGTPSSGTLTNATGLPISTGLTGAGTGVLTALAANTNAGGGVIALADPGADRIVFWDDSGSAFTHLTVGAGLNITTTTLTFDQSANQTPTGTWDFSSATVTFGTVSITTINATSIVFEGTADDFETTLGVTDPTADRTVTIPDASGDVVLTSSGVLLSNITLGEGPGCLLLDNALSADGKWSGTAISGTAGAALAFGDLVYFAAADSRWELADADAASTAGDVLLGICVLAAAGDGSATTILLQGMVRADAVFPALTISAPVYVDVTAGDITLTKPSATDDVVRCIGHAFTADVLYFNPDGTYITAT